MLDIFVTIYYALSTLYSLTLIGVLWWITARFPQDRRLWGWLTLGVTLNMTATILWGIEEAILGQEMSAFVDVLYTARYLLVAIALWLYPRAFGWRQVIKVGLVMAVGAGILWFGGVQILQAVSDQPDTHVVALAFYPLLDVGMVALGWMRWDHVRHANGAESAIANLLGMVALSMTAYGIANWMNFVIRSITPGASAVGPNLFWLLEGVFLGIAAYSYLKATPEKQPNPTGG